MSVSFTEICTKRILKLDIEEEIKTLGKSERRVIYHLIKICDLGAIINLFQASKGRKKKYSPNNITYYLVNFKYPLFT